MIFRKNKKFTGTTYMSGGLFLPSGIHADVLHMPLCEKGNQPRRTYYLKGLALDAIQYKERIMVKP